DSLLSALELLENEIEHTPEKTIGSKLLFALKKVSNAFIVGFLAYFAASASSMDSFFSTIFSSQVTPFWVATGAILLSRWLAAVLTTHLKEKQLKKSQQPILTKQEESREASTAFYDCLDSESKLRNSLSPTVSQRKSNLGTALLLLEQGTPEYEAVERAYTAESDTPVVTEDPACQESRKRMITLLKSALELNQTPQRKVILLEKLIQYSDNIPDILNSSLEAARIYLSLGNQRKALEIRNCGIAIASQVLPNFEEGSVERNYLESVIGEFNSL
ncbi:MAG: hypothetical protein PHU63_01070, partial [Candidatus ainarchaeum sp.]|nr:hypothetical protein [Candidatus ainarchaeum sp.]